MRLVYDRVTAAAKAESIGAIYGMPERHTLIRTSGRTDFGAHFAVRFMGGNLKPVVRLTVIPVAAPVLAALGQRFP